ncbi:hypothetical protein TNIN_185051 [Trichonephila inaurata madagascariensis]|uniref:Uncharacterized protein n=1 Tax=Trichonephila inaurata madagascariensis TaxID=2747483 RepID=A0A8X6I221_9ARAC|nr:hypothetical protein TNIN_185051 [Trichonephila inaurata madagascariensis]
MSGDGLPRIVFREFEEDINLEPPSLGRGGPSTAGPFSWRLLWRGSETALESQLTLLAVYCKSILSVSVNYSGQKKSKSSGDRMLLRNSHIIALTFHPQGLRKTQVFQREGMPPPNYLPKKSSLFRAIID